MTGPLADRLRSGRPVNLVNADHPDPGVVALLARLGADAVLIDCEQGTAGLSDVDDMLRAARLGGTAAVVRVPCAETWVLERYLRRGVDGVVVPRLDTAAQAAAVVRDVGYCRPHDRPAVIVQVESAAAVADLDALLAVAGLDCLFVGPVDLARSLGHADHRGPQVRAVLEQTVARIRAAGRPVGMLVDEHDVRDWLARGVRVLYGHADGWTAMGARAWHRLVEEGG